MPEQIYYVLLLICSHLSSERLEKEASPQDTGVPGGTRAHEALITEDMQGAAEMSPAIRVKIIN